MKLKRKKSEKKPDEVFIFTDATHPTYNSKPAYGWIRKGEERQIKQTTGRQRLNILGSLNIDTKQVHPTSHKTVNTEAFKGFAARPSSLSMHMQSTNPLSS